MLKARPYSLLVLTCLLMPCARAQRMQLDDDQLAQASLELGLKVLRDVQRETSAVVVPHSIFDGLAMLLEGAKGTTEQQLLKHVFRTSSADKVQTHQLQQRQTIGNFSETKMNYADIVTFTKDTNLAIRVKGVKEKEIMNKTLVNRNSKETMTTLNMFILNMTNGVIKDAFEPKPQDSSLLLTNVVHFKALWKIKFPPSIPNREFKVESDKCKVNGKNPMVTWMYNDLYMLYKKVPALFNAAVVRLPFGAADNETSFYILLPEPSVSVDKMLSALNGSVWRQIVHDLTEEVKDEPEDYYEYSDDKKDQVNNKRLPKVSFVMPVFNISTSIPLKETLENMGATHMFNKGRADFGNFNGGSNLFVGNVKHQAFLKINEFGAEGAGKTQAILLDRSAPEFLFRALRPFAYVIANSVSGDVYFMGRFMGPNC